MAEQAAGERSDRCRGALLALALGLLPLSGCLVKELAPGSFARQPVLTYNGPPIEAELRVAPCFADASGQAPPALGRLLARSLYEVLAPGGLFSRTRYGWDALAPAPRATPTACPTVSTLGAARPLPVVRLEGAILRFALLHSYLWLVLYGLFFAIPVIGTGAAVWALLLAGVPIVSEHVELELELRTLEARTGRELARYRLTFARGRRFGLYNLGQINEGDYYNPERLLGTLAHRAALELLWDRWRYYRWVEQAAAR
ncbi:MAG: hypothetical protein KatS3mg102_2488 [Planctomycetota bacterium]|nr:MAG: hypothetical protein KatS3mg102_2488 [Planctomycetota bacterium]